jgi:hypothetical protein
MTDDPERPDLDARLRAALAPDEESVRRVVTRALAEHLSAAPRRTPRYAFGTIALVLAAVVAAIVSSSRGTERRAAPTGAAASISITGRGSLVTAEASDGRRWIVGAPPDAGPRGGYVIVIRR